MPSGATPNRGASQPATDGSLTFSASQAPSGASLVEHAGQLTWHEKHCQLTLPQAKGWKKCDTQPWGDRNLHLHLDHAEALAAMGLPDDGSNRSESFLDARRGAMCDQMESCSTPSSLSSLSPTDQRVREQIQAARARKLLRLASSTPGIYAWAARAAPPRPTTRSRPSQAKQQRTQPAMMKGPLPTRFTIDTIIRRYHAKDRKVYTYEEFLYHYAARGWSVEAVRTLWEGLPRARDHLLV